MGISKNYIQYLIIPIFCHFFNLQLFFHPKSWVFMGVLNKKLGTIYHFDKPIPIALMASCIGNYGCPNNYSKNFFFANHCT